MKANVLVVDDERLIRTSLERALANQGYEAEAADTVASALAALGIELRYMRAVLALTGGNKLRAAEHLGITRQTLAKRLGDND